MMPVMPQRGPKRFVITRHARERYEARFPGRASIESDLRNAIGASTALVKRLRQCNPSTPKDSAFWVNCDVVFAGTYERGRFIVKTVLIRPLSKKQSIRLGEKIRSEAQGDA